MERNRTKIQTFFIPKKTVPTTSPLASVSANLNSFADLKKPLKPKLDPPNVQKCGKIIKIRSIEEIKQAAKNQERLRFILDLNIPLWCLPSEVKPDMNTVQPTSSMPPLNKHILTMKQLNDLIVDAEEFKQQGIKIKYSLDSLKPIKFIPVIQGDDVIPVENKDRDEKTDKFHPEKKVSPEKYNLSARGEMKERSESKSKQLSSHFRRRNNGDQSDDDEDTRTNRGRGTCGSELRREWRDLDGHQRSRGFSRNRSRLQQSQADTKVGRKSFQRSSSRDRRKSLRRSGSGNRKRSPKRRSVSRDKSRSPQRRSCSKDISRSLYRSDSKDKIKSLQRRSGSKDKRSLRRSGSKDYRRSPRRRSSSKDIGRSQQKRSGFTDRKGSPKERSSSRDKSKSLHTKETKVLLVVPDNSENHLGVDKTLNKNLKAMLENRRKEESNRAIGKKYYIQDDKKSLNKANQISLEAKNELYYRKVSSRDKSRSPQTASGFSDKNLSPQSSTGSPKRSRSVQRKEVKVSFLLPDNKRYLLDMNGELTTILRAMSGIRYSEEINTNGDKNFFMQGDMKSIRKAKRIIRILVGTKNKNKSQKSKAISRDKSRSPQSAAVVRERSTSQNSRAYSKDRSRLRGNVAHSRDRSRSPQSSPAVRERRTSQNSGECSRDRCRLRRRTRERSTSQNSRAYSKDRSRLRGNVAHSRDRSRSPQSSPAVRERRTSQNSGECSRDRCRLRRRTRERSTSQNSRAYSKDRSRLRGNVAHSRDRSRSPQSSPAVRERRTSQNSGECSRDRCRLRRRIRERSTSQNSRVYFKDRSRSPQSAPAVRERRTSQNSRECSRDRSRLRRRTRERSTSQNSRAYSKDRSRLRENLAHSRDRSISPQRAAVARKRSASQNSKVYSKDRSKMRRNLSHSRDRSISPQCAAVVRERKTSQNCRAYSKDRSRLRQSLASSRDRSRSHRSSPVYRHRSRSSRSSVSSQNRSISPMNLKQEAKFSYQSSLPHEVPPQNPVFTQQWIDYYRWHGMLEEANTLENKVASQGSVTHNSSMGFDVDVLEEVSDHLSIPEKLVCAVIGDCLDQISQLQVQYGCMITVAPDSRGSSNMICTLTGSQAAVSAAKDALNRILQDEFFKVIVDATKHKEESDVSTSHTKENIQRISSNQKELVRKVTSDYNLESIQKFSKDNKNNTDGDISTNHSKVWDVSSSPKELVRKISSDDNFESYFSTSHNNEQQEVLTKHKEPIHKKSPDHKRDSVEDFSIIEPYFLTNDRKEFREEQEVLTKYKKELIDKKSPDHKKDFSINHLKSLVHKFSKNDKESKREVSTDHTRELFRNKSPEYQGEFLQEFSVNHMKELVRKLSMKDKKESKQDGTTNIKKSTKGILKNDHIESQQVVFFKSETIRDFPKSDNEESAQRVSNDRKTESKHEVTASERRMLSHTVVGPERPSGSKMKLTKSNACNNYAVTGIAMSAHSHQFDLFDLDSD